MNCRNCGKEINIDYMKVPKNIKTFDTMCECGTFIKIGNPNYVELSEESFANYSEMSCVEIKKLINEQINYIEKSINYTFPSDYKEYILDLKPLKISNNTFKTKNGYEKVLRCLHSFENDSKTYILEAQLFDSKYKLELVPFGLLEFGDLICFNRKTNDIVMYNHELDEIEIIAKSFNEFFKMLY